MSRKTIDGVAAVIGNVQFRRWRNQPVQKEAKKYKTNLLTKGEEFWLNAALIEQFHSTTEGNQLVIIQLAKKLGNVLRNENITNLANEFENDIQP